jgi:MFS family permease
VQLDVVEEPGRVACLFQRRASARTGVTTVALGLLAYDLAGNNAGAVLGGVLALKMVAYVALAPVIAAYARRLPRRELLVSLDLTRALVVLAMPFVTAIWQVCALVLVLNACSAGFTPAFQATIPDILIDERDYTRALSLSRVAYDLADLASPVLAAALLLIFDFQSLFYLDGASFLLSAALVVAARLPASCGRPVSERTWARITHGVRRYLTTPRLRGLLALDVAAAAASAMVIVNTVVIVHDWFGAGDSAVAVAFGVAGAGSLTTAVALPRLLDRFGDRPVMLTGAALLAAGLILAAALPNYPVMLSVWFLLGVGQSMVLTPSGRLIQRSGSDQERPLLFAAQFSLSHACWLATYPIAGVLGAVIGVSTVAVVLAVIAAIAALVAARLWTGAPPREKRTTSPDLRAT